MDNELRCDDGGFAEWTQIWQDAPSVIEQISAAAHDGAAGNHIVVNEADKVAYASRQNWATAMSLGELRAVGFWWKVLEPVPPNPFPTPVAALSIDGEVAALLLLNTDNAVRLATYHDGGANTTSYVPLFTGTEWHHVRLAVIRHDTAGGAQLYDGNTLLIDDAKYDTADWYDETPDWLHAGACGFAVAGLDMYQDEFRIAKTLQEAKPRMPIPRGYYAPVIDGF